MEKWIWRSGYGEGYGEADVEKGYGEADVEKGYGEVDVEKRRRDK